MSDTDFKNGDGEYQLLRKILQRLNAVSGGGGGGGSGDMLKSENLSGLASYPSARANLGLVIGTNVQAANAGLTSIAALTTTAYGRSVLELANAAAARTLFGAGDVIGPATSADDSIPIFNGTNNKILEASAWKITNSGSVLQSPILANPSGAALQQRWGGIMTSGGQVGGGNADMGISWVRDLSGAGNPTTKITDNWGFLYNPTSISGIPHYGWNFETLFDTSGAVSPGNAAHETYLVNQVIGNDAESPVGKRLVQWNVTLPNSFAVSPSAAATYNTANGLFPGHVALIGTLNSFSFNAYNSAQADRGAFRWATSAATSGISLVSNTGYTFADFTEWGQRTSSPDFAIVGNAYANFSLRTTTTGYASTDGIQFAVDTGSSNFFLRNKEAAAVIISPNSTNAEGLLWLSSGQRAFVGWDVVTPPTDSGAKFQVKGNASITSGGDTQFLVTGATYPGLKVVGTGFPSGVDIACESTSDFRIRINDNKPLLLMTQGASRMNIHSTNSSYAPFNIGPSATPGTSMARVKHGVATLVAGTVTVTEATVTANTRITATHRTAGGTLGTLSTSNSAGASFTITSTSALDTSTVTWLLVEP